MKGVIEIIMAVIFLLGGVHFSKRLAYQIKRAAVIKVSKGLPPLTTFTRKLSRELSIITTIY